MHRHLTLLLLFLLFLVPTLLFAQNRAIRPVSLQIPNGGEVQLYQGSYALVIGISDYQDNAWADLSSVSQDVDAVSEALQGHGFEVTQVLDPTESDLIDAMDDFIDSHGYDKDNRLLFYYAGHGHTIERDGRKFGYLVPVDAPSPIDNEKNFFRRAIKMERILSWAKQIESKHALFLFDSCFSGSVLESRAITIPEDISYSTSKPVRQFISAGSANQTVPAVSVFRPTFIRGINGEADLDKDGYVTGVELGMYLQKRVPYYQSGQTPQYGKIRDPYLDEGNFVFDLGQSKEVSSFKPRDCQIACEGLVGHYTFDDDVLDRSGFGNHGIKSKNIESVSDSKGNLKSAYQFNGNDSFIELKNPITSSDQDFTMMIYMKINKYEHRTDLGCPNGGGNRAGLISSQDHTASLELMYCPGWGTKVQHYPRYKYQIWYTNKPCQSDCIMEDSTFYSDLNIDQYYLISITYNSKSNKTKMYQNKKIIDTANWRAYPTGNLVIGNIKYDGYPFNVHPLNGVIDEVRIYNRSLSNSEISEIFQSFQ